MGLGKLFTHKAPAAREPEGLRVISDFAIIDGVTVDGSGELASRYRGAMGIPGAWRASVLLSDMLGSVPWHAFRSFAGRPVQMLDPTPLLLEQPNPPDTKMTTFSSWGLDLIYHGNAIGVVAARNGLGWPTAAIAVPADQVGVRRVTERFSPLPVGAIEYAIGGLSFGSPDIIHIKGPCAPGALRGMGVLEAHLAKTLDLASEQIRQAQSLSRHGVPTGYLTTDNPDTTDEELKASKEAWLANHRDRTVAALRHGTKFEPVAWNPEELQLVDARKFTLTELENIFGLPVGWLGGAQSSRTYSNIESDAVNLLKFTLRGHLARFEETLSLHMPRGTVTKANLDAFLRADTLTRYQAHAIALASKFMNIDEVRDLENLPPMATDGGTEADARSLVEMIQKVYLGVGTVLTADEARALLNRAGARLPIPAPDLNSAEAPIRVSATAGRETPAIEGSVNR